MADVRPRLRKKLRRPLLSGLRAWLWSPRSALFAALLGPSISGTIACETSCDVDEDEVPQVIETGLFDPEEGSYASSSFNDEWLEFPPKRRYTFHHRLGGVPKNVQTWVSFERRPLEGGSAAESAGNIALMFEATPEYVSVRNDTCQKFFLRLYASDPEPLPGADGAATEDGGAGGSAP